ncbi:hypothetical protein [Robertmurraya korlensis]|uniref:hypothetical protein n=1 Tax=Robertmurraya korlensis TaxID=519977 RepID=UPI000825BD6B|nr:hypothetical protein [Robertmurraya korlensis]
MKHWKFALIAAGWFLFFSYNTAVLAHEGEEQEAETYLKDFSTNEHEHSDTEEQVTDSHDSHEIEDSTHDSEDSREHDSHETEASTNHNHSNQEHSESTIKEESHDDSGSHDQGGGHGAFTGEETGPNYIVLSSIASVNAGFLLIGIWNRVRKGGNYHGGNK